MRRVLDLLQQRFGITTPRAITLDVWEAWGRDTDLMRTLADSAAQVRRRGEPITWATTANGSAARIRRASATCSCRHCRSSSASASCPEAEQRAEAQRKRKAKTDVVSECAMAILALMLARYPSMERFIRWYRQQIAADRSGRAEHPGTAGVRGRATGPAPPTWSRRGQRRRVALAHDAVRLELTIWRPYEFSQRRYAERIQHAVPGTRVHEAGAGRSVPAGRSELPTAHLRRSARVLRRGAPDGRNAVVHGAGG